MRAGTTSSPKTCRECGRREGEVAFRPQRRKCIDCQRAYDRQRNSAPERRAVTRAWQRANPDLMRLQWRNAQRRCKDIPPERWHGPRIVPEWESQFVDVEPFRDWLVQHEREWGFERLIAKTGLDPSHARRIIRGQTKRVDFDTVDDALLHTSTGVWELYPYE